MPLDERAALGLVVLASLKVTLAAWPALLIARVVVGKVPNETEVVVAIVVLYSRAARVIEWAKRYSRK